MTFLRLALAAVLVCCASVLTVSCVGILELDGYAGALSDLCEKLRVCFGDEYFPECEAHGGPRIDDASPEEREAWLHSFADRHCLESCANARACLDMPPVCGGFDVGCVQKEQCCGFLTGATECGGGQCCSGKGKACSAAGDCCDPALGCQLDDEENEQVCGGVACIDANEPCETSEQCCTGVCDPVRSICSEEICLPDGSRCHDGSECCTKYCERPGGGGEDEAGFCVPPPCLPDGAPCSDMEIPCCSEFCVENPYSGEPVCSSGECLPLDQFCADDQECCSGFCDLVFGLCMPTCGTAGDPCAMGCCPYADCLGPNDTCCLKELAGCISNTECCGGQCVDFMCNSGGMCGLPGDPCSSPLACCSGACSSTNTGCCDVTDCHDECVEGGPLSELCPPPTDTLSISCITDICTMMPECCCHQWDAACVQQVSTICSQSCPTPLQSQ